MKKVYTILFKEELSQTSSQRVFPFGLKVQWHSEEKLIDVQFSRKDAVGSGLIKDSRKISSKEKKELIRYALYKIKELIDSEKIRTANKLLINCEQFQIKDISQQLPSTWRVEDFLSKKPLTYYS